MNLPEWNVDVGFNSPNIPLFNFGIPYVADVNVAASFAVDFGLKVNLSAGFDTRGLNSPGKRFGGGPRVRDLDVDGTVTAEFFAFDSAFRGGVHVAVADVVGHGDLDLIVTKSDATTERFTLDGDVIGPGSAPVPGGAFPSI